MVRLGLPEIMIILIILGIVVLGGLLWVFPFWKILRKAGHAPELAFLAIIPLGSIGLLFFLAFSEWPSATHEARRL